MYMSHLPRRIHTCIAVGNLDKYLPYLLEQITSQPKLQYFLLSSLKEVRGGEVSAGVERVNAQR